MASLRKRFRVSWDDQPPVEITTSARDIVNTDPESQSSPAMATFAMLHAALVRTGHEPPPLDEWIDQVDEIEDLATVVTDVEGPTPLAASDGELSPSPA
jgi:hypothetical protein